MSKKARDDLTFEFVSEALAYNSSNGVFMWNIRPVSHFKNEHDSNKWNKRFAGKLAGALQTNRYRQITLNYKQYLAHRLAWLLYYGIWPTTNEIDHINGISDDNRIVNLREATTPQNQWNRNKNKTNKSGFKGVFWDAYHGKWSANISVNTKHYFLGHFADVKDAHNAYCEAALKFHGHFIKIEQ